MNIKELIMDQLPRGSKLIHHAIDMANRLIHFEYRYQGKMWRASIKLYRNRYVEKI